MRQKYTWTAFAACLAIGLGAMAWISVTILRFDRAQLEAQRAALLDERVQLALWRMDSALGPVVAQESGRPYFIYSAFYPAEHAYTRLFAELNPGEVLMPSPLMAFESPLIRLHFQVGADGVLTSPQVPTGNMLDLAEAAYVTHEKIEGSRARVAELERRIGAVQILAIAKAPGRQEAAQELSPRRSSDANVQTGNDIAEFQARTQQIETQQNVAPVKIVKQRAHLQKADPESQPFADLGFRPSPNLVEGVMSPTWIKDELLLLRTVTDGSQRLVQGCWLDFEAIQQDLLGRVRDLLPEAQMRPAKDGDPPARLLAALPVALEPGQTPAAEPRSLTSVQVSLIAALLCVGVATTAVALLMWGALKLSEDRATFVSAVTHELRTPLTTFRLYTEMLAEGMVVDEAKRQRYIEILHAESGRLAHLVENVLAFARVERTPTQARLADHDLAELVDGIRERLKERAHKAGMGVRIAPSPVPLRVRADREAVEQILFNLVDNACKYAADGANKVIEISVLKTDRRSCVAVCDHGPGIAPDVRRRLFRPFAKSAHEAAHTKPGVGLGLALSRRLARAMKGDLYLDPAHKDGARFILTLPSVAA